MDNHKNQDSHELSLQEDIHILKMQLSITYIHLALYHKGFFLKHIVVQNFSWYKDIMWVGILMVHNETKSKN